jgi:hypothetical protein
MALEIAEMGDEVTFGSVEDFYNVVDSVQQMADDPFMDDEPEEVYEELSRDTVSEVRCLCTEITAVAEALLPSRWHRKISSCHGS